jgi:cytochrome c5
MPNRLLIYLQSTCTNMKKFSVICIFCGLALFAADGCSPKAPTDSSVIAQSEQLSNKSLQSKAAQIEQNLPEGKGKNYFINYCGICHSLEYITMQPKLSKEIWEYEIDKMTNLYNAPIPDALRPEILAYILQLQASDNSGSTRK